MKRIFTFLVFFVLSSAILKAQWVQTNGPFGGNIYSLAINGNNIFAGSYDGGLFVSRNKGASWNLVESSFFMNNAIYSLDVNGNNVYVGTKGNLYQSSDNGVSWFIGGQGLPPNPLITAIKSSGNIIYALTSGGLYKSTNFGGNWAYLGYKDTSVYSIAVDGNNVFIGLHGLISVSTDNGLNWKPSGAGYNIYSSYYSLAIDGNTIYAGSDMGISVSTDYGQSWTNKSLSTSGNPVRSITKYANMTFATATIGLLSSSDNGQTWGWNNLGLTHTFFNYVVSNENGVFVGTSGSGVLQSVDNGASWNQINTGMMNTDVVVLSAYGNSMFACTENNFYTSIDNGSNWSLVNSSLPFSNIHSLLVSGNKILAGTFSGLYISTDNGKSWKLDSSGVPTYSTVTVLASNANNMYAGTEYSGFFVSTNGGTTWKQANSGFPEANTISAIATNGNNLFAGSLYLPGEGTVTAPGGVYISIDNGGHWTRVSSGIPEGTSISALAGNGNYLFAGTDYQGVFYSNNNGNNWSPSGPGLPPKRPIKSLASIGNSIFAAVDSSGIFLSTNNGANWSPVNSGFLDLNVNTILLNGNNSFAGTRAAGIFKRPISEMVPSVKVISPNGQEIWAVSEKHDIKWSSNLITNVKIEYSTNNGTNWRTIINSTPASSGTLSWSIPDSPSSQCLIRISDAANLFTNDLSDNVFTIKPGKPNINFSARNINYGRVIVDSIFARSISVTNNSSVKATLSELRFEGQNKDEFIPILGPMQVDSGKTVNINIYLNAKSPGPKNASLVIISNTEKGADTVLLSATAVIPKLNLSANLLDYKRISVNTASTLPLVFNNTSPAPVLIQSPQFIGVNASEISFGDTKFPLTINTRSLKNIQITYTPGSAGIKDAVILFPNNTENNPDTVKLAANVFIASLTVSTNELSYGKVIVNSVSQKTINIKNNSAAAVTIDPVTFQGLNRDEFSRDNNISLQIAANGSADLIIKFSPKGTGQREALLIINSNTEKKADSVKLTGSGTIPSLNYSAVSFDFGKTIVNTGSVKTITFSNPGTAVVEIQRPEFVGASKDEFKVDNNTAFPISLNPTSSGSFNIIMTPVNTGQKTTIMLIKTNTDRGQDTISLSGSGYLPALSIFPKTMDFTRKSVNSTTGGLLRLTNLNPADVTVSSVTLEGQDKSDFLPKWTSSPFFINSKESADLSIDFHPLTPGQKNAFILIQNNTEKGLDTVFLKGIAEVPPLNVALSMDFGKVNLNIPVTQMLKLINNNLSDVDIQSFTFEGKNKDEFTIPDEKFPFKVTAGSTHNLKIQLTSVQAGSIQALLLLTNNSSHSPDTISISGNAVISPMSISANKLDFGKTDLIATSEKTLTLINNSSTIVNISGIQIVGDNKDDFIYNGPASYKIDPQKQFDLLIQFKPRSKGGRSAYLLIRSDTEGKEDTVKLTGTGTLARLLVSNSSITFDKTNVNASNEKSFNLTNQNPAAVNVSNMRFEGLDKSDFSIKDNKSVFDIPGNGTQQITVAFQPKVTGDKNAKLLIESNAGNGIDTVSLIAKSFIAGLTYSENNLDFGSVNVNITADKIISIKNNTPAEIQIINSKFTGTDNTEFYLKDLSPSTPVGAFQTKNVTIVFAPSKAGDKTADLVILNNTQSGSDTIHLSGKGTIGDLTFSDSKLDFGLLNIGEYSEKEISISNSSPSEIRIDNIVLTGANRDEFSLQYLSFPIPLQAGHSISFPVKFTPKTSGIRTAALEIQSNSSNSPNSIQLTGSAVSTINVTTVQASLGQSVSMKITPPPGYQFNKNKLFYRRTGESAYNSADVTITDGVFKADIPADYSTIRGIQYYIVFSDGTNTVTFPRENPVNNPASLQITASEYSYPLDIKKSIYQMISIPLSVKNPEIDSVLTQYYGTYDKKVWRVFRWDPSSAKYLEYQDIKSKFVPGNAFWLISRDGKTFQARNGTSVKADTPYTITLENGWNQIANPFSFSVDWDSIQNTEKLKYPTPIYRDPEADAYMDSPTHVLLPWTGYWVYNSGERLDLIVRPLESKNLKKQNSLNPGQGGFVIQIKASDETGAHDFENFIGMITGVATEINKYTVLSPPPISEKLFLDIEENNILFMKKYVPVSAEGAYWHIRITSAAKDKNVKLEFVNKISLPGDFKMWLLDMDRKVAIPLSGNKASVLLSDAGDGNFRFITGSEKFAKANSENISLIPLDYSLFQNYPNPFNSTTRINYQLKEKSNIVLEIYDILGRRVRILADNELQDPGVHNYLWDGTNSAGVIVSSGIYIYRLKANDFVQSKRMMMIK